ncbi:MinD/ParA family protein [Bacillus sp. Bva_UNVM-123]|uniref:MinD/ParA family protein n=1 Tax=Bacillus sp. Bva_UNVM-123 TaxID=2829798 RepID=UPI00391FACE3
MKDQAEDLRLKLSMTKKASEKPIGSPKTVAVVSGKGGVGKSNISLSFSLSLIRKGYKVLLFDMDLGMGNLDILMGKSSEYSIVDFFDGKTSLRETIMMGPTGLKYIAGGSGLNHLVGLDDQLVEKFTNELYGLFKEYDYVIFDMGAGVTEGTLKFILAVQEIIVITTPEPTSLTDAYGMMKHIHLMDDTIPFYIVVNRIQSPKEGQQTYSRISKVMKNFLGRDSVHLGAVPDDRIIQQAVRKQIPFVLFNEKAPASKAIADITERYEQRQFNEKQTETGFRFISKLKQFLFER